MFSEQKINQQNKKLCCIYFGNEYVLFDKNQEKNITDTTNTTNTTNTTDQRQVFINNLIKYLVKYFKLFIVGDKLNVNSFSDDIVVFTINDFRNMIKDNKFNIDNLLLFDSLNYFYDNITIESNIKILLQTDNTLKLYLSNGLVVSLYNNDYLNKLSTSINKIICIDRKTKNKFANDYGLLTEQVDDIGDDYFKIFEFGDKITYKFKSTLQNNYNGVIYSKIIIFYFPF